MGSLFAPSTTKDEDATFSWNAGNWLPREAAPNKKRNPQPAVQLYIFISKGKLYAHINVVTIREIQEKNGIVVS